MFDLQQILFSAAVGMVVSLVVLYAAARIWSEPFDRRGAPVLALLVGVSILVWRLGANVPQLNADPIPVTSPNDVLCPVVTYVVLSVYLGLRGSPTARRAGRERALLTLVSLVVNIVTI
jgi:hypothetical protein